MEGLGRRQDLYLVELRDGLKFASGNPITACRTRLVDPARRNPDKTPAFILTQFGLTKDNVKDKVKASGPLTLSIENDKAYAPSFVRTA